MHRSRSFLRRPGVLRVRRFLPLVALAAAGIAALTANAGDEPKRLTVDGQPIELGVVRWGRDYADARKLSVESGKPIFLLFQEVPGCATCVGFGESVLSHPEVVRSIETDFVPLAIHNNKLGADRSILKKFGEPSWNNPVVRFLGTDEGELIPRKDGVWTRPEIVTRMIAALEAADRKVPESLRGLYGSRSKAPEQRATLAMHCFWTGEACLGGLDGVVSTRPGWLGGREVVEVNFDPERLSYRSLIEHASKKDCADAVFAHDEAQRRTAVTFFGNRVEQNTDVARNAKPSDDKRYLRRSSLRHLDLSPEQSTRINAALAAGTDPLIWLRPEQLARWKSEFAGS